jgi:hypothetical protein
MNKEFLERRRKDLDGYLQVSIENIVVLWQIGPASAVTEVPRLIPGHSGSSYGGVGTLAQNMNLYGKLSPNEDLPQKLSLNSIKKYRV